MAFQRRVSLPISPARYHQIGCTPASPGLVPVVNLPAWASVACLLRASLLPAGLVLAVDMPIVLYYC